MLLVPRFLTQDNWWSATAGLCFALWSSVARLNAAEGYFDGDGVKIRYVIEGQGEPLVLIHGFAGSVELQWYATGVLQALSRDYRVLALDLRGHGRSGKPHDPAKYGTQMVEDVVRLLDHLDVPKAHVVGYSLGGIIAQQVQFTYPERLLTVTLGGAGWSPPDDPRRAFLDKLADSLEKGEGVGPLLKALTPKGQPEPSDQEIAFVSQLIKFANDTQALAAVIRSTRQFQLKPEQLAANSIPTLALVGELDPFREVVEEMQPLMANLEVEVIEDADHLNAFQQPQFVRAIRRFIRQQSGESKPDKAEPAGGPAGESTQPRKAAPLDLPPVEPGGAAGVPAILGDD